MRKQCRSAFFLPAIKVSHFIHTIRLFNCSRVYLTKTFLFDWFLYFSSLSFPSPFLIYSLQLLNSLKFIAKNVKLTHLRTQFRWFALLCVFMFNMISQKTLINKLLSDIGLPISVVCKAEQKEPSKKKLNDVKTICSHYKEHQAKEAMNLWGFLRKLPCHSNQRLFRANRWRGWFLTSGV